MPDNPIIEEADYTPDWAAWAAARAELAAADKALADTEREVREAQDALRLAVMEESSEAERDAHRAFVDASSSLGGVELRRARAQLAEMQARPKAIALADSDLECVADVIAAMRQIRDGAHALRYAWENADVDFNNVFHVSEIFPQSIDEWHAQVAAWVLDEAKRWQPLLQEEPGDVS